MIRISIRQLFTGAAFALASGILTYVAFTAAAPSPALHASDGTEEGGRSAYSVETLAEASAVGGFAVKEPTALPQGFQRNFIAILPVPEAVDQSLHPDVMMTWGLPETSEDFGAAGFLELIQSPTTDDLGDVGAVPVQVAGAQGKRSFYPADESQGRPVSFVNYFWKVDGVAYILTGYLGDQVTEDDVRAVADSLR